MNEVIIKPIRSEIVRQIFTKFSIFSNNDAQPQIIRNSNKHTSVNAVQDLPENEDEMFEIDNEIIFDINSAKKILGEDSSHLIMELLKETINTIIPQELPCLETAHAEENWQAVADICHKLKGGFLSIGLTRAATSCKYLERYHKAGKNVLLENLYQQVLETLEATSNRLKEFTK